MMQYLTPKKSVKAISDAQKRSDSAQAVAELMFVKAAQAQQLDDASIAKYPEFFVTWDENWRGKAGDIVKDEGKLYRSIHDVTDAGQNRKPSETPSMWTQIGNPLEEFPDWVQPLGAHDAYSKGAKVSLAVWAFCLSARAALSAWATSGASPTSRDNTAAPRSF